MTEHHAGCWCVPCLQKQRHERRPFDYRTPESELPAGWTREMAETFDVITLCACGHPWIEHNLREKGCNHAEPLWADKSRGMNMNSWVRCSCRKESANA